MEFDGLDPHGGGRSGAKGAVTTVAELESLDEHQILDGYRDGLAGLMQVERHRCRSYTHGYLNGLVDSGNAQVVSAEQALLARDAVASGWLSRLGAKAAA